MSVNEKFIQFVNDIRNNSSFKDIEINIFQDLDRLSSEEKGKLTELIINIISNDPSHSVSGVYCLDNVFTKPTNVMLSLDQGKLFFNYRQKQIIILENGADDDHLEFAIELLKKIGNIFCFVSGNGIVSKLKKTDFDNSCDNLVFVLKNFNKNIYNNIESKVNYLNILDYEKNKIDATQVAEFCNLLWGYTPEAVSNEKNPHIIVLDEQNNPMGGSRANALVGKYSVIGGVGTLPKYRKRGVGTAVSVILSKILLDKGTKVALETDIDNFPAIKIYEKIGFERVGNSSFFDFGTTVIRDIQGDRDY